MIILKIIIITMIIVLMIIIIIIRRRIVIIRKIKMHWNKSDNISLKLQNYEKDKKA